MYQTKLRDYRILFYRISLIILIPLTCGELSRTISPHLVSAQSMTNEEFILDLNPSKTPTSQSPTPQPTDSPRSAQQSSIRPSKLRFSVDNTSINYGKLAPGEPIIRNLTIVLESNTGASILASENDTLKSEDNREVPDSTCDEGTCSELIGAAWTNPLTYGFGHRCENIQGKSCTTSFLHQNIYKQLSNISNQEKPVTLIETPSDSRITSKINFKVNIPASLSEVSFSNTINLVALPKLENASQE